MSKAKQVALFDSDGWFAGLDSDYGGPPPHNSTHAIPDPVEGFIPRWTGNGWEWIENHRGESGYVNGEPVMIEEYGPLPEGWSGEYVDPRTPGEIRRDEIQARLKVIDRKRVRPMAKILAGGDAEEDRRILASLEAEATELRAELATLQEGGME